MEKDRSIFTWAAAGNLLVVGFPLLIGLVLAFAGNLAQFADTESLFFYVGIGLMAVGWILLVRSKWHQLQNGELFRWGVSDPKMRLIYRLSYVVMIAGYLLSTFSGKF